MRPGAWGALGVTLGGAGVKAYRHAVDPTSQLYGRTICHVPTGRRLIALTFDDGPDAWSEPVLTVLERAQAKATFFVIGRWAEQDPGLVRAIADRGHALGNHTWSHAKLPRCTSAAVGAELLRTETAVERAGAQLATLDGLKLMRPPYGQRRPGTLRAVRRAGYVPVMWSVTGFDWGEEITAGDIVRNCAVARDGDVILLHDGCPRRARSRAQTVIATERVIDLLAEKGYRFVTVVELLAARAPADARPDRITEEDPLAS